MHVRGSHCHNTLVSLSFRASPGSTASRSTAWLPAIKAVAQSPLPATSMVTASTTSSSVPGRDSRCRSAPGRRQLCGLRICLRLSRHVELSSLDGNNGFRISGELQGDFSGTSVGAAGDVNGDGFADLIIGAYGADPHGLSRAGATYVVYRRRLGLSRRFATFRRSTAATASRSTARPLAITAASLRPQPAISTTTATTTSSSAPGSTMCTGGG